MSMQDKAIQLTEFFFWNSRCLEGHQQQNQRIHNIKNCPKVVYTDNKMILSSLNHKQYLIFACDLIHLIITLVYDDFHYLLIIIRPTFIKESLVRQLGNFRQIVNL